MHLYKRKKRGAVHWAFLLGIFICTAFLLLTMSRRIENTTKREQTQLLSDAINQAVVSCYATEGKYPESLDYLIEHYGIQIDKENYIVIYDIFADNIRPRIQVIPTGDKK